MAYDFNKKGKKYCICNKDDVDMWIEDIKDPLGIIDVKEYPYSLDKIKEDLAKGDIVIEEVPDGEGGTYTEIFLPLTAKELEERPDSEAYLESWVF